MSTHLKNGMTTDDTGKPVFWWFNTDLLEESQRAEEFGIFIVKIGYSWQQSTVSDGGCKGNVPCTSYSRAFCYGMLTWTTWTTLRTMARTPQSTRTCTMRSSEHAAHRLLMHSGHTSHLWLKVSSCVSFHVIHACALVLSLEWSLPHPFFYFLVLFLFQFYLMSNSASDEFLHRKSPVQLQLGEHGHSGLCHTPHIPFLMTDGDSMTTKNLCDSAKGTFVTLDDNLPLTERTVRRVKECFSAVLLQSGLNESWWADSMECFANLRNVTDLFFNGKTPYERRFGKPFEGPVIPFGSLVWVSLYNCERSVPNPSIWKESFTWIVPRIRSSRGGNLEGWRADCRPWGVGNDGRIGTRKDSMRNRWYFPNKENLIFPIADGRIKTPVGDQELRTSTLILQRPIQGESHVDFLGESEGSLPQPHDSLPDAGEATNDFWSMSGIFIPPSRWTKSQTVLAERKNHSPFHWNTLTLPELLKRIWMSSKRSALMIIGTLMALEICLILGQVSQNSLYSKKKLLTDILGPEGDWRGNSLHPGQIIYGQSSGNQWRSMPSWKEKQKCTKEKLHLENARKLRGIYFIDPEDTEFEETIKSARKKLESSVAPAMPCKIEKNCESAASDKNKTKLACILEADESTKISYGRNITKSSRRPNCRKRWKFITALQLGSQN